MEEAPSREGRSRSRSRSPEGRGGWRNCGKSYVPKLEAIFSRGDLEEERIEKEVLVELSELSEEESEHVIRSLSECEFEKIKNPSRFLAGIIRRVRKHGMLAKDGLDALRGPVRDKVESLLRDGKLGEEDLTRRVCEVLTEANEKDAIQGLESYAAADTGSIRSKSGYILGIMRRVQGEERRPRSQPTMMQSAIPGAAFLMPYGSLGIYSTVPTYPGMIPQGFVMSNVPYDGRDRRNRGRRDEDRRTSRKD